MVKVERSYPAPESLAVEAKKANGSYKEKDVVERLKEDFHDKCYICEMKGLQDPEVEHLLPHKSGAYPERKFDWDNLFWCCGHCNSIKNNDVYDVGIIDCCHKEPESLLRFSVSGENIMVEASDKDDLHTVLTATLICATFNKRNTGIRVAASDNRKKALNEQMDILYRELDRYKAKPDSKRNKRVVASLLRRESSFAAFKRAYVRERISEYPDLAEYVKIGD